MEKLMKREQVKRIFKIGELDGFYVDEKLDRTVHITLESEDTIVIDIFDTAQAAYDSNTGNALGIVELNLKTGDTQHFKEGR
ncbi:MAG: hypothetical protein NOU37_05120 [Candidatus Brocadiales bacterium]|nr:hypothetical protein [Candidatus Bathyanammoxibius amoris]